jgi:hypothetical protein
MFVPPVEERLVWLGDALREAAIAAAMPARNNRDSRRFSFLFNVVSRYFERQ